MDDAFLSAYFSIDRDMSGQITKDELVTYRDDNNLDDAFVNKWLRLFDRKGTGIISIENFCDVLGLELKEVRQRQQSFVQSSGKKLPSNVEVIYSDMTMNQQYDIVQFLLQVQSKYSVNKDIVQQLKKLLDLNMEKLWHVVMVQGQYWAYYSHEPEYSFIFKMGRHIFLIWRTPAP